jgi:hypothetical protein
MKGLLLLLLLFSIASAAKPKGKSVPPPPPPAVEIIEEEDAEEKPAAAAAAPAAAAPGSRPDSWFTTVEEMLASHELGPLRADLTPAAFAQRTRAQALAKQIAQFRGKVVGQMLRAMGTAIRACPLEDTSKEAIKAVRLELVNRTFAAHWHAIDGECGRHRGFLHVSLPEAKRDN